MVTFYTRVDCSLCDKARPLVEEIAAAAGLGMEVLDVDGSDDLRHRFGARVPVVTDPHGEVIAEGQIVGRRLKKELRKLRRRA